MKKGVKIGIGAVVAIVVIVSMVLSSMKGITTELYNVESGYQSLYFTEEGIIGSNNYYNIYSPSAGEVLSVKVAVGDEVKKGDIIGEISSTQLDLQIETAKQQQKGYEAQKKGAKTEDNLRKSTIEASIDELNSQLETLKVQQASGGTTKEYQLDLQQKLVDSSKKEYEKLENDLEKYKKLYDIGAISKSDYEKYESQVDSARIVYEQNKTQLEIIKNGNGQNSDEYYESAKDAIEVQIINLKKQLGQDTLSATEEYYSSLIAVSEKQIEALEKQKEDLVIKSPFDGVVSELPMTKTNYVSASSPVAVVNMQSNLIETYISTRDVDTVRIGSPVKIVVEKREGKTEYDGEVTSIENEAKVQVSAIGVEERKIKVNVAPSEDLGLITGFDVDVEFLLYEEENAVAVPKESVFEYENGFAVYKVVDGKATITPVEKGTELRSETIITNGLQSGDVIVKDGTDENVQDGVKISE